MHAGQEPTFVCLWIAPTLLSDVLITNNMAIVFAPTHIFTPLHTETFESKFQISHFIKHCFHF